MLSRTVAIRLSSSSFLGFALAGVLAAGLAANPAQAATTTYDTNNTPYTGGTIDPGDTVLLNDGATVSGNVTDNGTLQFNQTAPLVVTSTISGTGTLALTNSGTLNLSGTTVANATIVLDMATSVSAGLLQIRSGIGQLRIGSSGTGTLNVNGGSVTGLGGFLGFNAGSVGLATVSSGTWATTGNMTVGRIGIGMLDVYGGRVTSDFADIGAQSGGYGSVTVSSGTLSMNRFVTVGRSGTGRLNVTGGLLMNASGTIGAAAGGFGTAEVSGGTWSNSGDLVVGASGNGTLTMNGGLMTVGGILSKGVAGTINLNSGGTLQIGAGSTGGVLLGGTGSLVNDGTLIFNRSDASTYSGDLSGSGKVAKQGAGQLTLAGANSYSGLTTISTGTIALSGTGSIGTGGLNLGTTGSPGVFDLLGLTASSYSLPSSAALAGVGTISGNGKSLAVLGSLAPGNSTGTITVGTGLALDLSNSGTSLFEITSPAFTAGTFDLVNGDGSVVFGGILDLAFSGGSYADGTDVLQIFAATGGRSGNFSAVNATGLASGQSATFNPATGTISVVPEPSTYVIAGLSSVGLAGMMRCRKRRAAKSGTGAMC
jgi:autotransporter-associated beta strand protein/T5SS/PEP-CTERM-associated repeat protein